MFGSLKDEIVEFGRIAGIKDYTPGVSGNISARLGDKFIITASGSANGFLGKDDFSVINSMGEVLEGNPKPSMERFLHLAYYEKRNDINCIFHVHSPYLTAFASAGIPLDESVSPEILYSFDKIPVAEYAIPGSGELVNNTSKFFEKYDVILMANHGVIVAGDSVKSAFLKLDLAESYAKTVICAKILGGVKIIEEEEVQKIHSLRRK